MEEKIKARDYEKDRAWWHGCVVGLIVGLVIAIPSMVSAGNKRDECLRTLEKQNEVIERYKVQTETMMAIIDELSKEKEE